MSRASPRLSPLWRWCLLLALLAATVPPSLEDFSYPAISSNSSLTYAGGAALYHKVLDLCGVCDGNSSSCAGCDGVPNSGLAFDSCGQCLTPCTWNPALCTFLSTSVWQCPGSCLFNLPCSDCAAVPNGLHQVRPPLPPPNSGRGPTRRRVYNGGQLGVLTPSGVCGSVFHPQQGGGEAASVPWTPAGIPLPYFRPVPALRLLFAPLPSASRPQVDVCGQCLLPSDPLFARLDGPVVSCLGCDKVPFSGLTIDACGVCGGRGCSGANAALWSSCCDCAATPYGTSVVDFCCECLSNPTAHYKVKAATRGPSSM